MTKPNIIIENPHEFCILKQETVEDLDNFLAKVWVTYISHTGHKIVATLDFEIPIDLCETEGGGNHFMPFVLSLADTPDILDVYWQLSYPQIQQIVVDKKEQIAIIRDR